MRKSTFYITVHEHTGNCISIKCRARIAQNGENYGSHRMFESTVVWYCGGNYGMASHFQHGSLDFAGRIHIF